MSLPICFKIYCDYLSKLNCDESLETMVSSAEHLVNLINVDLVTFKNLTIRHYFPHDFPKTILNKSLDDIILELIELSSVSSEIEEFKTCYIYLTQTSIVLLSSHKEVIDNYINNKN